MLSQVFVMANVTIDLLTPSPRNDTSGNILNQSFDFEKNPGLVSVLIACCFTATWLLFITFYNSHILAFIVTKILSKFYLRCGSIYIGSFSVSLLSGKIMFKDVRYITKDYSVQIVDGLAIFKWWLKYKVEELNNLRRISKDQDLFEVSMCSWILQLNGFEFHLFNRSDLYTNIKDILKSERYGDARKSVLSLDVLKQNGKDKKNVDESSFRSWQDLFPLVNINIRSGKLAIGNRLLETTLWVHFNTATAAYCMPDAPSSLDHYTHFLQSKCDDVRVLLSRSPGYEGSTTDSPKYMGQGFVVLQAGHARICYYQDEPGLVPVGTGDASPEPDPEWACDLVFSKSTTITYGPWIDKQRDAIKKYFLPSDFQEIAVTKPLEPEQKRSHSGFDVKVEFVDATTIDLLFSKNEITSAIHVCCNKSSSVHFYQPWTVNEYGYTSNIVAHLHQMEVSTSMQCRKLLECEMIEVAVGMMIPRMWNHFQHWTCELWLFKTTLYFIYEHVHFFNDLLNDWSAMTPPDIATFVPYEWEFNFYLRDFELVLLVNKHNWIDCTNENENSEIALCGEALDVNFLLPFTHFMPKTVETKFFFRGETVMLRSFVPESNTLRRSIIALAKSSDEVMYPKVTRTTSVTPDFDQGDGPDELYEVNSGVNPEDQVSKGWRQRTSGSGWVDVWSVPVIVLNLFYKYHPIPVTNDRIMKIDKQCGLNYKGLKQPQLASDVITVELEAGPSAVKLFGYFWRQFFTGFKNNYFGVDQVMQEFNTMREGAINNTYLPKNRNVAGKDDIRHVRPLEANITVVLLDVQAELTMHTINDLSSPQAYIDCITFEMHKTFQETRLQLITSPISIVVENAAKYTSDHLNTGFLSLSSLQFRGHAMFSDKDIQLGSDTIEYAWLMEIQCGNLKGKISPLQLYKLLSWSETFLLHGMDDENNLINPHPEIKCQHNLPQSQCSLTNKNEVCPTEEAVKYKMVRFAVESVNVFVVEVECACNLLASPIRFSTCNSSNQEVFEGGSVFINEVVIRQYIQQANFSLTDLAQPQYVPLHSNSWVEVGVIGLGQVTADITELGHGIQYQFQQSTFLTLHDMETKRLWFLWNADELKGKFTKDRQKSKICGCVGGCNFFGSNKNGVNFFTNQSLDTTNEMRMRYGSDSLWGEETDFGSSIKEQYLHRSSHYSSNCRTSSTKLAYKYALDGGSHPSRGLSSTGTDTIDHVSDSFFGDTARRLSIGHKDTGSKIVFGRSHSHSLINGSESSFSLSKADSDKVMFYSCNSIASLQDGNVQQTKDSSQYSKKSGVSSESYVSAISSAEDFLQDKSDGSRMHFQPLVSPGLLLAYSNYMQPLSCINWQQNVPCCMRKKFSLLKNLKVICPPVHRYTLPSIPNFNPDEPGKLPFVLVRCNKLSDKKSGDKDGNSRKKTSKNIVSEDPKKTRISLKLYQRLSITVTPLMIQALDRYMSSLKALPTENHLSHVLDSFHLQCINKTKYKFLEKKISEKMSNYIPVNDLRHTLHEIASPTNLTVAVQVPEIDLVFFQIVSERYTPSEQSSLSGQCGSEFSYDLDIKNTDSILLAVSFTNVNLNLHEDKENDAIFNSTTMLVHKVSTNGPCKESIQKLASLSNPNVMVCSANIFSIQAQVLHLEGVTDKHLHITCIPRSKSTVNFSIKPTESLHLHHVSLADAIRHKNLGNIIFEAGIHFVKVKGVVRKSINKYLTGAQENNLSTTNVNTKEQTAIRIEFDNDVNDKNDGFVSSRPARYKALSNSSSSFESNSSCNISKAKKGYTRLYIDSGDDADMSEEGENEDHVSFLSGSEITASETVPTVHYKKKTKKSAKEKQVAGYPSSMVGTDMVGHAEIKTIWINLAAPTHLRNLNGDNDQEVNLVTVLVPALSCWMLPMIDILGSVNLIMETFRTWKFSITACLLGQALPEHGRLLKKHICPSAINNLSKFLQEDYSSQLISVIRRQTVGHRLINLQEALKYKKSFSGLTDLREGIFALARQWKCIFIGAEEHETIFTIPYDRNKKPVVGRGKLTQKDREFLTKDIEARDSEMWSQHLTSPVLNLSKSQILSPHRVEYNTEPTEHDMLLSSSSESESENKIDNRRNKDTVKKEQTLYDWMSKSPVSSPVHSTNAHTKITIEGRSETGQEEPDSTAKKHVQNDFLQTESPMISVPTSGMQLARATEVFASLLDVVGIKQEKYFNTHEIMKKGSFAMKSIKINLVTSEEGKDEKKHPHAFELKRLQLVLQSNQELLLPYLDNCFSPTNILCIVDVTEIHQHLNFALVRLMLQITETLNVVKEEKKFVEKSSKSNSKDEVYGWKDADVSDPALQMPKCWRNMFNVMKLYTMLPDEQPVSPILASPVASKLKGDVVRARNAYFVIREDFLSVLRKTNDHSKTASKKCLPARVPTTLFITATAVLKKVKLTANISGLQLDFEMRRMNGTYYKNKEASSINTGITDASSSSVHMEKLKICLIESVKPFKTDNSNHLPPHSPALKISRTLMTCKVYPSHILHTTSQQPMQKSTQKSLFFIGPIAVDIPQNPGALRAIVARFTNRLQKHFSEFDDYRRSERARHEHLLDNIPLEVDSVKESLVSVNISATFRISSSSILCSASLLPSLRVEYKIDQVSGYGSMDGKAKFYFQLKSHVLCFNTKCNVVPLPATTHIDLPQIKINGHYLEISSREETCVVNSSAISHGFLRVTVNIERLEQNLTTDLLNHIIFLQKGFAKEVSDVMKDIETNEPVPLWKSRSVESIQPSLPMIYSIQVTLQNIQVTASTPSSIAVKLETGEISLVLSNKNPASSVLKSPDYKATKTYGKAQVEVHVSIGQFNKVNFVKKDQDYDVFAHFSTLLEVNNTLQEKPRRSDRETIVIALDNPHFFLMSAAVDKGVLVYLHYKNAYNYWMGQRTMLTNEFPAVAEHILNRLSEQPVTEKLFSYLFLQVNIHNLGVCLPLKEKVPPCLSTNLATPVLLDSGPGSALLVSVEESSITGCSSGSFVSTGLFRKFCLRFVDNFDHTYNNWQIDESDIMNTYTIPEGSYDLCSRTISADPQLELNQPGKWIMTLFWKMCGVNIHMDSNIGKKLNLLTNTLTAITGDSDVADLSSVAEAEDVGEENKIRIPNYISDDGYDVVDAPTQTTLQDEDESLERQLWLQTRIVNQFRRNNAHPDVISREVKQLQEIEVALSKEFFKDVKSRFKRSKKRSTLSTSRKSFIDKKKTLSYLYPASKSELRALNSSSSRSYQPIELKNSNKYAKDEIDASSMHETVTFDTVSQELTVLKTQMSHESYTDEFIDIKTVSSDENEKGINRVTFSKSTYNVCPSSEKTKSILSVNNNTALDFELNVVVDIESGKCTFHTESSNVKDVNIANRDEFSKKMSGQAESISSRAFQRPLRTMWSVGQVSSNQSTIPEKPLILIPGVNVRLRYLSKNVVEEIRHGSTDFEAADVSSQYSGSVVCKHQFNKTANLNAFVSIQSLPKEMIVRPSLLDFLDKALEPIIRTDADEVRTTLESESLGGTASFLSSSGNDFYSFPVNVVVLIRVEPSDLRFSCLPLSRVEFLLRVPSLDFVVTSSPSPIASKVISPKKTIFSSRRSNSSQASMSDVDMSSGFSFTLCLSRFSFCIFHPYGKQFGSATDRENSSMLGAKRKEFKPTGQPISGRKDSLSLNVEFIKFNLFRKTIRIPKGDSDNSTDFHTNVKISALCDIGSAAFNYDMRRLNEILDVPKAWYKRGLMQRIFLGKDGTYATQQSTHQACKIRISRNLPASSDASKPDPLVIPKETSGSHRRSVSTGASFFNNLMRTPFTATPRSKIFPTFRNEKHDSVKLKLEKKNTQFHSDDDFIDGPSNFTFTNEWQTKIAVGFKISRIDVSTNMGNVMGQVIWSTNDLRADANGLLNNTGVRGGQVGVFVRQGTLDAHGGVIGGYLEMQEINVVGKFQENFGELPIHCTIVGMKSGEVRLDYMGSSVVMAALSSFLFKLEDRWLLPSLNNTESTLTEASENPTEIHLMCDSQWNEFQVIVCKSTTPDLLKMAQKLQDFFHQQQQSSALALSSLCDGYQGLRYYSADSQLENRTDSTSVDSVDGLKYQHWVELLNGLYGKSLNNITARLPDKNIVLGGTLGLHGNFVSIACFHGSNFRSQNWGLFTIREPCLQFVSETRVVEKSCQVMRADSVHDVVFLLGSTNRNTMSETRRSSSNMYDFMATVRKVSRGRRNPPSLGAPVQEWLIFVNTTSKDDIPIASTSFTSANQEVGEKFSHTKLTGGLRKVSFAPKYRYENQSEVIFALPRLSVQLKTEHDQPTTDIVAKVLREADEDLSTILFPTVPSAHLVDSSLISHFDDSIHVTMDVSLLFYLHNLILSYMKEKETMSVTARHMRGQSKEQKTVDVTKNQPEATIKKEEKYREFRCKSWKLEPRVRLLSWAGKRMDPVSIDWVLEKLGFMHAALTIPKWIQRGALDPMDVALATLMGNLLAHMKKKEVENEN